MAIQRILKFPLREDAGNEIKCRFLRLLDIQVQNSIITAWVLTDSEMPEKMVNFVPIGTGWEIPVEILEGMEYVKTVQDDYGYVWHYYMKV